MKWKSNIFLVGIEEGSTDVLCNIDIVSIKFISSEQTIKIWKNLPTLISNRFLLPSQSFRYFFVALMSYFIRMFSRKDVTCDIYLENLSSVKWKFLRFCHLKKKKKKWNYGTVCVLGIFWCRREKIHFSFWAKGFKGGMMIEAWAGKTTAFFWSLLLGLSFLAWGQFINDVIFRTQSVPYFHIFKLFFGDRISKTSTFKAKIFQINIPW